VRAATVVAIALSCACSADVDYSIGVRRSERADRPVPAQPLTVLIDGVARDRVTYSFGSSDEAAATTVVLELAFGDDVVAAYPHKIGRSECGDEPWFGTIEIGESFCQYDNGELRFASRRTEGTSSTCIGDGFCLPQCSVYSESVSCGDGRCTSRITHFDPIFSRLACAPTGPKQLGDVCTYINDDAGAFDDCGRGLLCVEGICRQICGDSDCVYVAGHASELRVRM
jgi:hypothetical protein